MSYVKENPIPVALIGAGVGLMVVGGVRRYRRAQLEDAYERFGYHDEGPLEHPEYRAQGATTGGASEKAERARDRLGDARAKVEEAKAKGREKLSDARHQGSEKWANTKLRGQEVKQRAGREYQQAKRRAEQGYHRAEQSLGRMMHERPLAVGAAALAAGAAIGLLLPRSSMENRALGPSRDKLMDMARRKAEAARDIAEMTLQHAAETARTEVEQRSLTPEGIKRDAQQQAQERAGQVREAARQTAREAADYAREEARRRQVI